MRAYLKKRGAILFLTLIVFPVFATESSPFNDTLKEVPTVIEDSTTCQSVDSLLIDKKEEKVNKENPPSWRVDLEFQQSPVKTENPDPIRRESKGGVLKGYFYF